MLEIQIKVYGLRPKVFSEKEFVAIFNRQWLFFFGLLASKSPSNALEILVFLIVLGGRIHLPLKRWKMPGIFVTSSAVRAQTCILCFINQTYLMQTLHQKLLIQRHRVAEDSLTASGSSCSKI